ncbi:extensin family protein [Polyangium aurulentum]|uniref:extensin-like domain-containing protein n=1 Tax=Polyangium aurulentum TaxID=2567896 RepID=UPI00197CE009|nr:extensin family protein [Polyangium aurulentum]UQA62701.1 extensin family protein [Polyangium aurulentum]
MSPAMRGKFLQSALAALAATAVLVGAGVTSAQKASAQKAAPKKEPSPYLADRLRTDGFLKGGAQYRAQHAQAQWENLAQEDGAVCREALKTAGIKFTPLADRKAPDTKGCGIPHGVMVSHGPTGIRYSPPLVVDCSLAATLPKVEAILQEEAERHLGAPIARVGNLGTYSCRSVRGWAQRISQHALGNAMDFSTFHPKRGRAVTVMRDYVRGGEDTEKPEERFLRAIYRRLWSESGLTRVLGPDWDAAHRDHLHLDRGRRGWRFP